MPLNRDEHPPAEWMQREGLEHLRQLHRRRARRLLILVGAAWLLVAALVGLVAFIVWLLP